MRTSAVVVLILVGACATTTTPAGRSPFEPIVSRAHAAGTFDGVVIVTRDDRVVYRGAIGLADRARAIAHRPDEVVRLASITKQLTAALVMREVGRGTVALDAPIATYLPELGADARARTVRQLLQHTSGLPNPDTGGPETGMPAFYLQRGPVDVLHSVCAEPPTAPAGKFAYNNCDYLLLGAILERATHGTYAALVAQLAAKLELPTFAIATETSTSPVVGYLANGAIEPAYNVATFGAAGALLGSVDDLARWGGALLHHRVVDAPATATMFRGDPALGYEALGSWSYELEVGTQKVAIVERQGEIQGMRLLLLLLPKHDVVIAIAANTERAELFDLWQKRGLPYELIAAAIVK